MEIKWLKYSPTENMTALVLTQVPVYRRAEIGIAIMNSDPEVEQVCFVVPRKWPETSVRVETAGGEFSGSGAMCAAAYFVRNRLSPGSALMLPIESVCVGNFITCVVSMESDHCRVSLDLPLPLRVDTTVLSYGGKSYQLPIIRFPGIAHAVLPTGSMDHLKAEEAIREWTRVENAEAMGLIFYNSATSYIEPLVYVPAANTLCWERSCASGSAALGAFLCTMARSDLETEVRQPGGTIRVRGDWRGGKLSRIAVNSRVELLGENTLTV